MYDTRTPHSHVHLHILLYFISDAVVSYIFTLNRATFDRMRSIWRRHRPWCSAAASGGRPSAAGRQPRSDPAESASQPASQPFGSHFGAFRLWQCWRMCCVTLRLLHPARHADGAASRRELACSHTHTHTPAQTSLNRATVTTDTLH